ncbi:MAG TPA: hypothetical protein VN112_25210 [Ensifer sp.]|nr:hypothetical protein [Ensifer sp.]
MIANAAQFTHKLILSTTAALFCTAATASAGGFSRGEANTDTWTLGFGAQYKAEIGIFGIGTAVSHLAAGSQSVSAGSTYDATSHADWAFGMGVSYSLQF